MPQLKILISGGGVAGPCLAWWLIKANVDAQITIVERAPEPRTAGHAVDIRGAAVEVMKAMGLEQAVRDKTTTEEGFQFVYQDGVTMTTIDATGDDKAQGFTSEYEILRGDLSLIFYDAIRDKKNIEYVFDECIKEINQETEKDKVRVTFTNRLAEASYDLVVGADGQISRTRRLVFGRGPQTDNYIHRLGQYMAFCTIPRISSDTKYAQWFPAAKGRALILRPSQYNDTRAFLGVCDSDLKRFEEVDQALKDKDEEKAKTWLTKELEGTGWQSERILDEMWKSKYFYMQEFVQIKMGQEGYAKGRVALLGDAGYCPSPVSGMGTTLAIVGAYVLAGEISSSPTDIPTALQRYVTTLRPFVEQSQKLLPGLPQVLSPQSTWGLKILHFVVGVYRSSLATKMLPWVAWALPRTKEWELPKKYSEL